MSIDNQGGQAQKQYTCTLLREVGMLQKAPPCCPYCHANAERHEGKEGQHFMRHERTPAGHLLILCCHIDDYLRPINSEIDNELKVIEGHIGA